MNFDKAFERLISHEGGFQNDRADRGNWTTGIIGKGKLKGTKFGISAMSYPTEDIENLTIERAKYLYKRDFWDRAKADEYHGAIAYQLFDMAVNHGNGNAIRMLQRAAGVLDDGSVGPMTLAAIAKQSLNDMLLLLNAERLEFYSRVSTFARYGKGWSLRVAGNLRFAAKDN